MAYNWNRFPYTNNHELNLDWFNEHFKEIFEEWESLYNALIDWKNDTDTDLAQWKEDTLSEMDAWENELLAALDEWKTNTNNDISDWEADIIADLNDWKETFLAAYESLEERVEAIVSDTEDMVENLAEPFSALKNYNIGDYVIYQGVLYRFTTNHNAGAWNDSDANQTTALNDIDTFLSILQKFNSFNYFENYLDFNDSTVSGITFTWTENVCTVSGTASGSAACIIKSSNFFPYEIKAGEKYYIKYKTTNPNVQLRIIFRDSSNNNISTVYVNTDSEITIPNNATKWHISIYVASGTSISGTATVSNIAFINSYSNTELTDIVKNFSDYFKSYGVLPNNTDLDNVKTIGCYGLTSTNTYINAPFGYGVLCVYPGSNNTIGQIFLGDKNIFYRHSISGSYNNRTWNIGGTTINTQSYNNTYNITTEPTITTDTNNYLPSINDTTDRTSDIQTLLNTTGVCHLGPGDFYITGVELPDYSMLIGSGYKTRIILASSVTTGYAIKMNNSGCVKDLRLIGSTSDITPTTPGTRNGIIYIGGYEDTPSVIKRQGVIDNIYIRNFSGSGIYCNETGTDVDLGLSVSNVWIKRCGAGIYIERYSEYHKFNNIDSCYCYYGIICNSGNCLFSNCNISKNTQGILIDNTANKSPNNAHGVFSCCKIAHSGNNTGKAIEIIGSVQGENFNGVSIDYGTIDITNSNGIQFTGCRLGYNIGINASGSIALIFDSCNIRDASTVNVNSTNSVTHFINCYNSINGNKFNPLNE